MQALKDHIVTYDRECRRDTGEIKDKYTYTHRVLLNLNKLTGPPDFNFTNFPVVQFLPADDCQTAGLVDIIITTTLMGVDDTNKLSFPSPFTVRGDEFAFNGAHERMSEGSCVEPPMRFSGGRTVWKQVVEVKVSRLIDACFNLWNGNYISAKNLEVPKLYIDIRDHQDGVIDFDGCRLERIVITASAEAVKIADTSAEIHITIKNLRPNGRVELDRVACSRYPMTIVNGDGKEEFKIGTITSVNRIQSLAGYVEFNKKQKLAKQEDQWDMVSLIN